MLASLSVETVQLSHGSSALGVQAAIPNPQPNPWWVGEVAMYASCPNAGVYNAFLGNVSLTHLFASEYNHLTFTLPANVKAAFQSNATCKFDIALNVSNGAGQFLLDRLGFE